MFRKLLNCELGRPDLNSYREMEKIPVAVVLDNVRSQHNIGSAFRTCDAFRISEMILCGISSTPPSAEIHKSALGAEFSVSWRHEKSSTAAITRLKAEGYTIISVEQTEDSVSLDQFRKQELSLENGRHYAVVFGNEVHGVDQDVVNLSDMTIEIPQYGTKHSLNVSVAIGIILYTITGSLIKDSSDPCSQI